MFDHMLLSALAELLLITTMVIMYQFFTRKHLIRNDVFDVNFVCMLRIKQVNVYKVVL